MLMYEQNFCFLYFESGPELPNSTLERARDSVAKQGLDFSEDLQNMFIPGELN